MNNQNLTKLPSKVDDLLELSQSRGSRRFMAEKSFQHFLLFYFPHYLEYQQPEFHKEIIELITKNEPQFVCIVAFRGSAKSTLCSFALPIWRAICTKQKKFVVIICQNQNRASQTLINIRRELENNELLINDFGPFLSSTTIEWNFTNLMLDQFDAKISAVSIGETNRGMRHGAHRPDLMIADDIEDVQSSKTLDLRDKLWGIINGEIIPLGSPKTSFVFIGNLVHQDSVMMRLKNAIQSGKKPGVYREYPLLDDNNQCLWPSKYPDQKSIDNLKNSISENEFAREYQLQAISNDEQIIKQEWIEYYDQLPSDRYLNRIIVTIDPAFSVSETAAKTAMITASLHSFPDNQKKMYIHPNPVNFRLDNTEFVSMIKAIYQNLGVANAIKIIVEEAGQQGMLVEELQGVGIPAEGMKTRGSDKRTRLWSTSNNVKQKLILFPREGCEELIKQIVFFDNMRYYDLADSFSMAGAEFNKFKLESEPIIDFL